MKKLVRYYSLGLLTSAAVLLAVYMFTGPSDTSLAESDPEDMIALLEDQGYSVLTQEQYIKLSVKPEEDTETGEAVAAEDNEQKEEDKDVNDQEENSAEEDGEVEADIEKEEQKEEVEEESSENTEEDSVVHYKLSITPGMASSDVSSLLANENIIENASEFNSYLDEHDYSQYVQQGNFELSSDMSFYEIAERIAR